MFGFSPSFATVPKSRPRAGAEVRSKKEFKKVRRKNWLSPGESLKRSPRRIRPMADEARQGLLNGTAFAKATPNVFASRRLGKRVTSLRARLRLGRQVTGDRWYSLGLGAFC